MTRRRWLAAGVVVAAAAATLVVALRPVRHDPAPPSAEVRRQILVLADSQAARLGGLARHVEVVGAGANAQQQVRHQFAEGVSGSPRVWFVQITGDHYTCRSPCGIGIERGQPREGDAITLTLDLSGRELRSAGVAPRPFDLRQLGRAVAVRDLPPLSAESILHCGKAVLRLSVEVGPEGGTGESADTLIARNEGPGPCRIAGHPAFAFLDGNDAVVPFTISHRDSSLYRQHVDQLVVPVGAAVTSTFGKFRCDEPTDRGTTTARVSLPGTATTVVRLAGIFSYCGPDRPMRVGALVTRLADGQYFGSVDTTSVSSSDFTFLPRCSVPESGNGQRMSGRLPLHINATTDLVIYFYPDGQPERGHGQTADPTLWADVASKPEERSGMLNAWYVVIKQGSLVSVDEDSPIGTGDPAQDDPCHGAS